MTVTVESVGPVDTTGPQPAAQAPRRRRWWLWALSAIGVLIALVAVAEVTLRAILPGIISDSLRDALSLTEDHPVDVTLHGSAAWYALGANIGPVEARVPDAYLVEGLRGTLDLRAERVPFNVSTGQIAGGAATLTVDRDQLPQAIQLITQGVADSGEVRSGQLLVSRTVDALGMSLELSVVLGIEVEDGEVTVDPRSVGAAGFDLTAEDISARTGGALDGLVRPHTLCVRDRMPAGVTLTDIDLSSTGAVRLSAAFDPAVLSDPAKLEPGVCETDSE